MENAYFIWEVRALDPELQHYYDDTYSFQFQFTGRNIFGVRRRFLNIGNVKASEQPSKVLEWIVARAQTEWEELRETPRPPLTLSVGRGAYGAVTFIFNRRKST